MKYVMSGIFLLSFFTIFPSEFVFVQRDHVQQEARLVMKRLKSRQLQKQDGKKNNRTDRPKHTPFTMRINQPTSKSIRRG